MENILGYVPEKRQTLLFSATLPKWVNKVARRFQVCVCVCSLGGGQVHWRFRRVQGGQLRQLQSCLGGEANARWNHDWVYTARLSGPCIKWHSFSGTPVMHV